jgi:hypothetical protein
MSRNHRQEGLKEVPMMMMGPEPSIEPLYKQPHLCPVCAGRGNVPGGFYNGCGDYCTGDAAAETCRACSGTGVVWG